MIKAGYCMDSYVARQPISGDLYVVSIVVWRTAGACLVRNSAMAFIVGKQNLVFRVQRTSKAFAAAVRRRAKDLIIDVAGLMPRYRLNTASVVLMVVPTTTSGKPFPRTSSASGLMSTKTPFANAMKFKRKGSPFAVFAHRNS